MANLPRPLNVLASAVGLCSALAGCGGRTGRAAEVGMAAPRSSPFSGSGFPADWRRVATPADRNRLRVWDDGPHAPKLVSHESHDRPIFLVGLSMHADRG